ncbi:MAG TPA: hypothetical protein V6D29_13875 [Leptolyngbyaceae cyanobacterium]
MAVTAVMIGRMKGWVGLVALLLAPLGITAAFAGDNLPMLSNDAIARPPVHQERASPSGSHILILTAPENWATKQVDATLYNAQGQICQPLWSKTLPQEYGPRFALVSDQGQVVLIDEWINVASSYAVMLLDASGQVVAQHSFDDLADRLQMSRADIVDAAQFGWWVSRAPSLSRNGNTVQVGTAGKQLKINLETGDLSL